MTELSKRTKKKRPVWFRVFIPLMLCAFFQVGVLLLIFMTQGISGRLFQNELQRMNYLTAEQAEGLETFLKEGSDVDKSLKIIGQEAERLYEICGRSPQSLCRDEAVYRELIKKISPELVSLMRRNMLNGAYVILCSETPEKLSDSLPGVYLRDTDAGLRFPADNTDLQALVVPEGVAGEIGIHVSHDWDQSFHLRDRWRETDFFSVPYRTAWNMWNWESRELGYWDKAHYPRTDAFPVISYSVPLKLTDGTIYGVFGIEMSKENLDRRVACEDLNHEETGIFLMCTGDGQESWTSQMDFQGQKGMHFEPGEALELERAERFGMRGLFTMESEKGAYEWTAAELELYGESSPYEENWYLLGGSPVAYLKKSSELLNTFLITACIVSMMVGLLFVIWITRRITRPITSMVHSLRESDPNMPVALPSTGLSELDELGEDFTRLSQQVRDTAGKFDSIIKMASVELAVFELDQDQNRLFVSEGFLAMFGEEGREQGSMGASELKEFFEYMESCVYRRTGDETIYQVTRRGEDAWIRLCTVRSEGKWSGLAEDITAQIRDLQKLEYERDYDALTNLMNRRSFYRRVKEILSDSGCGNRKAAMLLLDLDNLKLLNDVYGHDWGDRYLQLAADRLREHVSGHCIVSRMSGDEFYLFYYGFDSREEIEELVKKVECGLSEGYLNLPDGKVFRLRFSGGIAWYPEDSEDYKTLMKYADFAMYKVKKSDKGKISNFHKESYEREKYLLRNQEELNRLIENQMVRHEFQPIVDVKTGRVFGYEALMRPTLATIPGVGEMLALARKEYKLGAIERLTWFSAMKSFAGLIERGVVEKDCRIFVNSIPNQILSDADIELFEQLYGPLLSSMVLEITEGEKLNEEIRARKRELIQRWKGQTAIDDYGEGYNGQGVLLKLSPEFIKIDREFVNEVWKDKKKQSVIEDTVRYGRENGIRIIAEGVENEAELREVVRLGADYVQGYFLGRGREVPEKPRREAVRILREETE